MREVGPVGGALSDHQLPPAGVWSFLWFVGFCFLTNQWQRTTPGPGTAQAGDAARAAIAFSFFSILSWVSEGPVGGRVGGVSRFSPADPDSLTQVALTVKALQRFRLGTDMSLFATDQLGTGAAQAYPGYPVGKQKYHHLWSVSTY